MKVNKFNRIIVAEFLSQEQLSPQTLKQYRSALRQFFWWVYENCDNKPLHELKSRDALAYQNYMIKRNLSSSAVKFKRSVVSSLCGFLEVYYDEDYPMFRNIFSKKIPSVPANYRREKEPITKEELEVLVKELTICNNWQMLAYLIFSYETGGRRSEVQQVKKEIVDYDYMVDEKGNEKNYYMTHVIRLKGRGKDGKKGRLYFSDKSKQVIKKWLNERGEDDCEYLFIGRDRRGNVKQIIVETFNYWCSKVFSKILGREIYPHLLRSSLATELAANNVPISSIQAILHHESPETTDLYIVRNKMDLIDDVFSGQD